MRRQGMEFQFYENKVGGKETSGKRAKSDLQLRVYKAWSQEYLTLEVPNLSAPFNHLRLMEKNVQA